MTDYAGLQHGLRVIPKTRTPSLEPGLYDAGGGTHPQDGLADQHARLADSATGPSPGGRLVNREPFDSLGHLDSPQGPIRFRLPHGGIGLHL